MIDTKSIRPISLKKFSKDQNRSRGPIRNQDEGPSQLSLDLGKKFRQWVPSFRLDEPIQALELSRHAETSLLSHHKKKIGDLLHTDENAFLHIKGLGQGHIDEVKRKLADYLKGYNVERCFHVDLGGLLRCVVADLDPHQAYLALNPFGLASFVHLTTGQKTELKHLFDNRRREMQQAAKEALANPEKRTLVLNKMELITRAFILPWMRQRHHLASKAELRERLVMLSLDPDASEQIINWLSNTYFENRFPPADSLVSLEQSLYATDQWVREDYEQVLRTTRSYFYHQRISYPLQKLIYLIQKDLSRNWNGLPESFIEKCLWLSPQLRVRKSLDNSLVVRLNPMGCLGAFASTTR